jgi:hypothetical protein
MVREIQDFIVLLCYCVKNNNKSLISTDEEDLCANCPGDTDADHM